MLLYSKETVNQEPISQTPIIPHTPICKVVKNTLILMVSVSSSSLNENPLKR